MKQATIVQPVLKQAQVEATAGLKKAVVVAAGIDLSVLGIPKSMLDRRPQELYYPDSFNPQARTIWLQMFNDLIFQDDMKEMLSYADAWLLAVTTFMDQCHTDGLDPFKSRKDPSVNNAVRNVMMRRRNELRAYVDRSRLLTQITPVVPSAQHTYEWLSNGNVRLKASLQFQVEGGKDALIAFVKSTALKMLPDGHGGYSRNLLSNLTVGVERLSGKKGWLYYTMEIKQPYHVPESKQTKQAKHDWFDKEFFNPMIRGLRFDTLRRRVKF